MILQMRKMRLIEVKLFAQDTQVDSSEEYLQHFPKEETNFFLKKGLLLSRIYHYLNNATDSAALIRSNSLIDFFCFSR